jgi:hypothetical protein
MLSLGVVMAGASRRACVQVGCSGLVKGQGQDGQCSRAPS